MSVALQQIWVLDRVARAVQHLADRLDAFEDQLEAGDETRWTAYVETAAALAALLPHLTPERRGALLTTAEMAARLQVTPKTLLRRKARGEIRPALQLGRRGRAALRWRGDEVGR